MALILKVPLYVQPGLADYSIVASLGMGRSEVGRVGEGTGYNAYPLQGANGDRIIPKVAIQPTGDFQILANVQEHWSMEGRAIVREANVKNIIVMRLLRPIWVQNPTHQRFGVKIKKKT